jgi:hypothetical protein
MSELDDIYQRAKAAWDTDPAKFEHEQPLLARAFAEAQPNRELADAYESLKHQLETEHNALARKAAEATDARDKALATLRAMRAKRDAERHAHTNVQRHLERQIQDLQRETAAPTPVSIDDDERQRLAALGWRKEAPCPR